MTLYIILIFSAICVGMAVLVDPPNVYGIGGTVLYHRGGKHGLQDDGEERTVGRDETVQALGGEHHPLLVVPTC